MERPEIGPEDMEKLGFRELTEPETGHVEYEKKRFGRFIDEGPRRIDDLTQAIASRDLNAIAYEVDLWQQDIDEFNWHIIELGKNDPEFGVMSGYIFEKIEDLENIFKERDWDEAKIYGTATSLAFILPDFFRKMAMLNWPNEEK